MKLSYPFLIGLRENIEMAILVPEWHIIMTLSFISHWLKCKHANEMGISIPDWVNFLE
jgi:hypothetical protein